VRYTFVVDAPLTENYASASSDSGLVSKLNKQHNSLSMPNMVLT